MSATVNTTAGAAALRRRRGPREGRSWVAYLVAIVVIGITVVPLLFVVLGGFRTNAELNSDPAALIPHHWVWSNYTSVLTNAQFWRNIYNSLLIAVVATAVAVGVGSMAAYALSRYNFRGSEAFYGFFVIGLLFPIGVAALPLFLLLHDLHMLEHWWGVAIPEAAFSLPATIVILRPFMRAVPGEIEDAAMIDGTSRLGFFWRILLPLSRPALITVAILAFVTSWNAYLLPLLAFNDQSNFTLPLGVANFQTQYTQDTAKILAFTGLSMVPALAFLAVAERRIVGGLTGAVKG
ncbi:carbohydrate ABC transporter permease [Actinocrinis puniceicyclus]|uniref:Carbohydrate ABC transporter permease n=1 Tax=Actinocrinis puniceicyclus TaxID=977794 RepID=A0A8J8BCR2_9ACTN|nr:carbohydrate ABC transporter permease [Actinocrinis puniceicyclus]MBS2963381.1 carbohydrate ABC transporter permease [Actinocrinis puniceicyclus]